MNIKEVKRLNLPTTPGCYKFLNKQGEIIYIGKAANLKSRIFSYLPAMRAPAYRTGRQARQADLQKSTIHTAVKQAMLKQVAKITWIETDSEIEALLLEANLIKKHQPPYNIVLRDDKRYVYIKVATEEDWPRIFMTRQIAKTGKYFGPFTSVEAVRITLKTIRKIWPFRSCANLPKKACLYFRIGKCPGMCETRISRKDYGDIVRQIGLFLGGRKKQVIKIYDLRIKNYDKKLKKDGISIKERDELEQERNILKYQLMNLNKVLANTNIVSLGDKYAADVVELAKVLGLLKVPERIEGYDISDIFGQQAVGSMVVFKGGEPNKSQYRKFKIKDAENQAGDVGMLKQILERRFKNDWPLPDLIIVDGGKAQLNVAIRVLKKLELDPSTSLRTSIAVMAVSKGSSREIPTESWGISRISRARGLRSAKALDKIFFPGEKQALELPLASPALHIIKRVRDEAHRFAVLFHRQLRTKNKLF